MRRVLIPALALTVLIPTAPALAQAEDCELRRDGPSRLDLNDDGELDVADPVRYLLWLFNGFPRPERQHDRPCVVERVDALESRLAHLDAELEASQTALVQALARIEELEVPGCMDPEAANFDCAVNVDDGSCEYPGCTDPAALNYAPEANVDDGSCYFAGDIPGFTYIADNEQGYPEYAHDATGIVFVRLPGGTFQMGTSILQCGRDADEGPVHEVTLHSFLLAKFELTQAQWKAVVAGNDSGVSDAPSLFIGDDLPVEHVSWHDIQIFEVLSGLQLPSEAQWEYACRAGTTTPFAYGEDLDSRTQASFQGADRFNTECDGQLGDAVGNMSRASTIPVGSLAPNGFGLYDMHGNVFEWCEDSYDEGFYSNPAASGPDPVALLPSDARVARGGSYGNAAVLCRSGNRCSANASGRINGVGFRPAFGPLP